MANINSPFYCLQVSQRHSENQSETIVLTDNDQVNRV